MKITKIRISNYLGIGSFVVNELGEFNLITGGNGVGKSTILKAIKESFKSSGTKHQLIKVGADKAEIHITIDDEIDVIRKITPTTNTVQVTNNGQPLDKPQAFLDDIIGPYQMNPVDFMLGNMKKRREILLKALPIPMSRDFMMSECENGNVNIEYESLDYEKHAFEVLAEAKKLVYDQRSEVNRDILRLKKSIEQDERDVPDNFNAETFADFNVAEKAQELANAETAISTHENNENRLVELREIAGAKVNEIEQLEQTIKKIKDSLVELNTQGQKLKSEVESFAKPDADGLRASIEEYSKSEELRQKITDIKRHNAELDEMQPESERLDAFYKRLDNDVPKELLSKGGIPIEGLSITDNDITLHDVSLNNLCTSEQMDLSLDVSRIFAGAAKFICIDRFESLDSEARAALEVGVANDGFEYFVTEVTGGELSMRQASTNGSAPQETMPLSELGAAQ